MVEELKTEGSLLLENTDMTIYFSPPIEVEDYLSGPLSPYRLPVNPTSAFLAKTVPILCRNGNNQQRQYRGQNSD